MDSLRSGPRGRLPLRKYMTYHWLATSSSWRSPHGNRKANGVDRLDLARRREAEDTTIARLIAIDCHAFRDWN